VLLLAHHKLDPIQAESQEAPQQEVHVAWLLLPVHLRVELVAVVSPLVRIQLVVGLTVMLQQLVEVVFLA